MQGHVRTSGGHPWKPNCPACSYELTGVPDGRCPECGTPFTLAALRAAFVMRDSRWRWGARRAPLMGAALALWFLTVMVLLPLQEFSYRWGRDAGLWGSLPGDCSSEGYLLWITVLWVFATLWFALWFRDRPSKSSVVLWIWVPLLRTLIAAAAFPEPSGQRLLAFEALIGFVMLSWPAWREPARSLWTAGAVTMASLLVIGAAYAITGVAGLGRGEWWSGWEDPRPGAHFDQFPLNHHETIRLGAAMLGVSVAIGIPLAWTARRVWRIRSTAQPPESASVHCSSTTD